MRTICTLIFMGLFAVAVAQNTTTFVVKKPMSAQLLPVVGTTDFLGYTNLTTSSGPMVPPAQPPKPQMGFDALGFQLRSGDSISAKAIRTDIPVFAFEFGSNRSFSVNSFKMAVTTNGKTETLSSTSSYLTGEMKKKLAELKTGSIIVLKEIKYAARNASPDDTYAGPYKLFIKE